MSTGAALPTQLLRLLQWHAWWLLLPALPTSWGMMCEIFQHVSTFLAPPLPGPSFLGLVKAACFTQCSLFATLFEAS